MTVACSCLAGVDVFVQKTASRGSCTMTIDFRDSWGLPGSVTSTITYPR